MNEKKISLFDKKEWLGEFFADDYNKRFPGRIIVNLEDGIRLDYTITGIETPKPCTYLKGILDDGQSCTLVGKFDPTKSGLRGNTITTRYGRNYFKYLLLGDFIDIDELFGEIYFSFTNMQEFFYPKGFKNRIKFCDDPILSVNFEIGRLYLHNNAEFTMLAGDITSQIYTQDKEALEKLETAYQKILKEHPNSPFMIKNDLNYYFKIELNEKQGIAELMNNIISLSNLFAILMYSPVYPEEIKFIKRNAPNDIVKILVYPSFLIEKRTLYRAIKEQSYFQMPISALNIDLEKIILKWLSISQKYSSIVSCIQNETGFRNEHSAQNDIVLFATQLESINKELGGIPKKKYETPLQQYASENLKKKLKSIFSPYNPRNIEENISDLRNGIAHVYSSKKLLQQLSVQELVYIGQCLQLVIISHILKELCINDDIIQNYQDSFCPRI